LPKVSALEILKPVGGLHHVAWRWMKVLAAELEGARLPEEKASLDCLITKNRPEVGL
jgi:hypothetical protein